MAKNSVNKHLVRGVDLQRQGRAKDAELEFLRVLKLDANNAAALYSLAAICENSSRLAEALRYISRAVQVSPRFAQAILAKSIILLRLGRLGDSLAEAETALSIDPSLPGASSHRAALINLLASQGTADPTSLASISMSGAEADDIQRAVLLQSQGLVSQAKQIYEAVLRRDSDNFFALYSLGAILNQEGEQQLALDYLDRAVTAHPSNPMGHHALGTVQQALGLYESALLSFDTALGLQPSYKEALINKCAVLHSMNRQLDAVHVMNEALKVFPEDTGLLNNMGYLLTEFKKNADAARFFKRLIDVDPFYENAQGLHLYAKLHACDWSGFEEYRDQILSWIREGRRVCNPMALMALTDDPEIHQKCAVEFGRSRFPEAPIALWKGERYRHRKKRVAFISADFREHPVGYLLIELLEKLPAYGYETVAISLGHDDGSVLYRRYRQAFSHYCSCHDKTSTEIARILRSFEVDIAIDLAGYTAGTRLEVLSHRPCPIQATYLGYPGTLGLPYIDYLIADYFLIPDSHERYYSEQVLKLPHSYLPRDSKVRGSDHTPPRREFGLPEEGLVFCSFNHDYKINPPMFDVWMQLLRTHNDSVLWLMELNSDARNNLEREANSRGVDSRRLIFASRVPKIEDHLARYRHVDVFLDTFPYGGHTTASDALLMGTPIVTLSGRSFANRVAGCMLTDHKKKNQIATSFEQYADIANMIVNTSSKERLSIEFPTADKQAEEFSNLIDRMCVIGSSVSQ
jgi:protein O-GlcNAc transferase